MSDHDTALAVRMVRAAAEELIAAADELCSLDSVAGDGDHGFAMAQASRSILARLDADQPAGVQELLELVGAEFAEVGGTMGALLYVAGDALAQAVPSAAEQPGSQAVGFLLTTTQDAITDFGGAKPGDKTMVDALDAARAAVADAAPDSPVGPVLRRAADGAVAGAASTVSMAAKIGRASRLGDIALGSADAGATSFAIIMTALATSYADGGE